MRILIIIIIIIIIIIVLMLLLLLRLSQLWTKDQWFIVKILWHRTPKIL